jgi:hypothetical protein
MDTNARVGTAIAAGYLFGRFKKLRLALMAGTMLASEDVRKSAVGLVQNGVGGLTSGGAGKLAGTAGSKLVDAGRGVAVAAAASRLERLTDRLAERNEALGGQGSSSDEDAADEDEYEEGPEDSDEDDGEEPEDEYEDEADDEAEDDGEEPEDEYEDEADDEAEDEDEAPPSATARRTRARRSRALTSAGGR